MGEKIRDSSEEEEEEGNYGELEGRKRQNSDEEEDKENKRQKFYEEFNEELYEGGLRWSSLGLPMMPMRPMTDDTYDPIVYETETEDEEEEEEVEEDKVDEDENEDDNTSYFNKDQLDAIQITEEESEVQLTDVERRYYLDEKNADWRSHWPTKAEMRALHRAIDESEEFDVPFLPQLHYHGTHRTNLTIPDNFFRVARCAKLALKFYNEKIGSDFKFDRLVMAATRPCNGFVYSVTFKATSESTMYTETFQTKVHVPSTSDVHVMVCRIKKADNQLELEPEQFNSVMYNVMLKKIGAVRSIR